MSRDLLRLRFSAQPCHDGEAKLFINSLFIGRGVSIVAVGIDLAKSVFTAHGIDESGKPGSVRPEVPRGKWLELVAKLPPCLLGMEACSGAHHWAREFMKFGQAPVCSFAIHTLLLDLSDTSHRRHQRKT